MAAWSSEGLSIAVTESAVTENEMSPRQLSAPNQYV
jgi:hypothetical protein